MGIQSLEIKFSKIRVNQLSSNQDKIQKSVEYIPVVVVQFDDESKNKESTITFISDKGEIAGSRMLNEEELSAIK